jgi:acyl-ACP thioesterase
MEKFTQQLTIRSFDTDQYAKASVTSLFNFMLEAAWAHAQVMEWGYDDLKNNNLFWVLSRVYFEIEKFPVWQEQITLNTWSAGTDGMYAYREFVLENAQKEVLLRGSTAWLILDLKSKHIFRLREFLHTFPRLEGQIACRNPKRIKPLQHADKLEFRPVLFSDLDVNQHFNSVKAFERVLDSFGVDFLNDNEPLELEINYLKEGLSGDRLAVDTKKLDENSYQSIIVRESDGADLCCMVIKWRGRKRGGEFGKMGMGEEEKVGDE